MLVTYGQKFLSLMDLVNKLDRMTEAVISTHGNKQLEPMPADEIAALDSVSGLEVTEEYDAIPLTAIQMKRIIDLLRHPFMPTDFRSMVRS